MEEGVHYACQRCGNCCRWHGEVPVTDSEIARIADFLGMELYDSSQNTPIYAPTALG
jgi:Fe-S-cluster containining protein